MYQAVRGNVVCLVTLPLEARLRQPPNNRACALRNAELVRQAREERRLVRKNEATN
jgi:hypothetical protein